jgi:NitT/TauT family transport system substrate-binding protein
MPNRILAVPRAVVLGFLTAGLLFLASITTPARAEVSEVRIALQFGLPYLPLIVARNQKLIEKHAQALGVSALNVTWARLGGGSAANDAVLSGSVDFASAGIAPLLLLWDRTRGGLEVKAVAGLDASAAFLNSSNPAIKSIKDFTDKDRIAVPAVKVSIQAVWLQIAAEQAFGQGQHDRLDSFTVALAHPDATVALLSGKSEISAHFATAPFNYQQLADPKIHRVTTSDEILGGPSSNSFLFTTAKFRSANPKVYKAVFEAVRQAQDFIAKNPTEAARIFVAEEQSKLGAREIERILAEPTSRYSLSPLNTDKVASFLYRVGTLKNKPGSWRDYTFPELHSLADN